MVTVIGGCLGIYFFSLFFEWAVTKRIFNDPVTGKLASVAITAPLLAVAYGFNTSPAGGWDPSGILIYGIGAGVIAPVKYIQGIRARARIESDIADTFS